MSRAGQNRIGIYTVYDGIFDIKKSLQTVNCVYICICVCVCDSGQPYTKALQQRLVDIAVNMDVAGNVGCGSNEPTQQLQSSFRLQ
jgi:putative aminopeptidase FrvX